MKDIIRQLFTESDNSTHDVVRWMAVLSILTALGLAIYAVGWNKQPFDMTQFGSGIGLLFAGVGAALKLKPESPKDSQ